MAIFTGIDDVRPILESTRSIAVLGASERPRRAGFYVPDYLASVGYEVWPVNPNLAGTTLWGKPAVGSLADLPGAVDLIDVFRRPVFIAGHTDEILALDWRPKTVWFQLGVAHRPSSERLVAAGIDVVENRCTLADHKRLFG